MKREVNVDQVLDSWFTEGPTELPDRTVAAIADRLDDVHQRRAIGRLGRIHVNRFVTSLGGVAAVVVAAVLVITFFQRGGLIGPAATPTSTDQGAVVPSPTPQPSVALGIFEPVAGRIVYGSESGIYGIEDGIWGLHPTSSDPATTVQLTSEPATPLGWSADGTRLLVQRGSDNLFVLNADGSETQVADEVSGFQGATISPDGLRVVYAGQTAASDCEDGVLFAVDADGGPAELLAESPRDKKIQYPTFSPDGTQIAFTDGNCDGDHIVWVMNADGTDPRQILSGDDPIDLGGSHVLGLAWSPAGDRIALSIDCYLAVDGGPCAQALYTFAPDGSNIKRVATTAAIRDAIPYWSPDGSRITHTTGCAFWDADGLAHECTWVIRDPGAESSTAQVFDYGMPGPWHPGRSSDSMEPTAEPSATTAGPSYCENPTSASGDVLGCSRDGTRLLIQRPLPESELTGIGPAMLIVLEADGSETLVMEQPWGIRGAAISPDGARVAFAGFTQPEGEHGVLFAVDADGGAAELLWENQTEQTDMMVRYPTFSPDGSQIAVVSDNVDTLHSVWVMNADGSNPHRIWKAEGFGPGHVLGLAWSPAGDRIAVQLANFTEEDGIYTLAPDGSAFTHGGHASDFCWPGWRC